jgi:hypothetical protein
MPHAHSEKRFQRRRAARTALMGFACALALILCGAAFATPPTGPERAASIGTEASAWTGVFCTASSCRGASRWTVVAFGAAVLAIGWMARRDSIPSA